MTFKEANSKGIRIRRNTWPGGQWLVPIGSTFVMDNDVSGYTLIYYMTPQDCSAEDWMVESEEEVRRRLKRTYKESPFLCEHD